MHLSFEDVKWRETWCICIYRGSKLLKMCSLNNYSIAVKTIKRIGIAYYLQINYAEPFLYHNLTWLPLTAGLNVIMDRKSVDFIIWNLPNIFLWNLLSLKCACVIVFLCIKLFPQIGNKKNLLQWMVRFWVGAKPLEKIYSTQHYFIFCSF